MAQLETLEAKMASIEISLSATSRRKKNGSVSGGITSPTSHRNRDYYKEVNSLRIALRDKENIIQTLKNQLCNKFSNRLILNNRTPPLTEMDRKATEERLQSLRQDADNKKHAIKNLKLALEHLDITDNIDVRIQQAELEYRLGREELELLTLREESRTLQATLELAKTREKQKNDTVFSCITGSTQITIHAIEVSADPKSPRFGAGPREDAVGLYIDWAIENSGLFKGDRILEVNGKLVVGVGRDDLARLLAVTPDAAQIVVLRKNESIATLRTLQSDNLRLTHRISYLEEHVRDLLAPRTDISSTTITTASQPTRQDHVQVFQKGPQVTALVAGMTNLGFKRSPDIRQSLPNVKTSEYQSSQCDTFNCSSSEALLSHSSRSRHSLEQGQIQLAKSTASLDLVQRHHHQLHHSSMFLSSRRYTSRMNEQIHNYKSRKQQQRQQLLLQTFDFDSEPTYYRLQDTQSRISEHSDVSMTTYNSQDYNAKIRPMPPKKPLRLSLHRTTSLQSIESAPPTTMTVSKNNHYQESYAPVKKSIKRNHRGDPPLLDNKLYGGQRTGEILITDQETSQPSPRTPSRAESCQSALRWPSPKPKPHLAQLSIEKWY